MKHNIQLFKPYINPSAINRVTQVLKSGWVGEGPVVKEFEDKLSQHFRTSKVVTVNSGTTALQLALTLANIKPGDEIITTAQTMMASSLVIVHAGAKPIFADIQYHTGNIDPNDIEHRITKKTKAILPVHWGGYPCDMQQIEQIAKKYNLTVIEDAAHAMGAKYYNRPIGSLSDFTCFSFQAIKTLTSVDGGAISMKRVTDYKRAKRLKWFGIDRDNRKRSIIGEPVYSITEPGFKYHMNDVNAAIGVENLAELPKLLEHRRELVKLYRKGLSDIDGIELHLDEQDRDSAHWLFTINVEKRLSFIKHLANHQIPASVVHLRIDTNPVFGELRTDLPHLNNYNKHHVCLPLHNYMTKSDVEFIIEKIKLGW